MSAGLVSRRALLAAAGEFAACGPLRLAFPLASDAPTCSHLARWRGFSLDQQAPYRAKPTLYDVWDFDFMREHGFDFVDGCVGGLLPCI